MSDPRIEDLLAEIVELRGSKAALQVEIDRLRDLADSMGEDNVELVKENERLKHERHTTKKLLEDVLARHGLPRP